MNNSAGKVLIAAPVHNVLIEGLQQAGYQCLMHENITQQQGLSLIADCTGVITSTRLLLDKEMLDAAPNLQWIGRMGSGMEIIDLEYAAKKNIRCFSSPEGNRNAVAEHALGLLLSVTKNISHSYRQVIDGKWLREENRGIELEGKTIGIIGFGHTGSAFARKLQPFDMNILAFDINTAIEMPSYVHKCTSLSEFYDADIISLHVPLNDSTYHMVDGNFIDSMNNPFMLLNTSRGPVVHNPALLHGLNTGKVTGAGVDVWDEEPLEKMGDDNMAILQQCLLIPHFIITPHIAGYSFEALQKMSQTLLNKIVSYS